MAASKAVSADVFRLRCSRFGSMDPAGWRGHVRRGVVVITTPPLPATSVGASCASCCSAYASETINDGLESYLVVGTRRELTDSRLTERHRPSQIEWRRNGLCQGGAHPLHAEDARLRP